MYGMSDFNDENNDLRMQLACACDKLNTWARELNVEECRDPYKNLELRNLVERIRLEILRRK